MYGAPCMYLGFLKRKKKKEKEKDNKGEKEGVTRMNILKSSLGGPKKMVNWTRVHSSWLVFKSISWIWKSKKFLKGLVASHGFFFFFFFFCCFGEREGGGGRRVLFFSCHCFLLFFFFKKKKKRTKENKRMEIQNLTSKTATPLRRKCVRKHIHKFQVRRKQNYIPRC